MKKYVNRHCLLGGVVIGLLAPFGNALLAAERCMRPCISEKAVYEQAQRLRTRTLNQGNIAEMEISPESEAGQRVVVQYFRPEALATVPLEFFIRYPFRPDLAVSTQLSLLFKIAQHIRNFGRDPSPTGDPQHHSVYQTDMNEETKDLLKNKELNRYMMYLLHVYSLNLHRDLDRPNQLTTLQQEALQELNRLQGFEGEEEVNLPTSWGMPVETHIRRGQYALWALQALSEITLNLSAFQITYPELRELITTACTELQAATEAFHAEQATGSAKISTAEFEEKISPFKRQIQKFLTHRWRLDPAEIHNQI